MLEVSWQYKSGLVTMNGSWISHDDQSSLPSYHVYNGGPFAYPSETDRMQGWFVRTMNPGILLKKIDIRDATGAMPGLRQAKTTITRQRSAAAATVASVFYFAKSR